MSKSLLRRIGPLLLSACAGALLALYFAPEKIKEVEVVKVVESKNVKKDVDTVTRIVERPDGTKETIVKERDNSTEHTDTSSESTKTKVFAKHDDWIATLLIGVNPQGFGLTADPSDLTFSLQRRLLLGIYVGPYSDLDGNFGVSLSLKF